MFVYGGDEGSSVNWKPHPLILDGKRVLTSEKIYKDESYGYEENWVNGDVGFPQW